MVNQCGHPFENDKKSAIKSNKPTEDGGVFASKRTKLTFSINCPNESADDPLHTYNGKLLVVPLIRWSPYHQTRKDSMDQKLSNFQTCRE